MAQEIYQVDAFADRAFSGNPAAVCLLAAEHSPQWMQDVAREMNLSETAFLMARADGFTLRWFTPKTEVDLCGHATLASAHILWEIGVLAPEAEARFHTRSGLLTATRQGAWIAMDFPAEPEAPAEVPDDLAQALGVPLTYVGRNRFDYLIEVEGEAVLRALKPDYALLQSIPSRGFIVTAGTRSPEYDFISRFFAPAAGVDEDPVTGSAHCCLGPFWSARLDRRELTGYQASARGGVVRLHVGPKRVILLGQAVTVLRATLWA